MRFEVTQSVEKTFFSPYLPCAGNPSPRLRHVDDAWSPHRNVPLRKFLAALIDSVGTRGHSSWRSISASRKFFSQHISTARLTGSINEGTVLGTILGTGVLAYQQHLEDLTQIVYLGRGC